MKAIPSPAVVVRIKEEMAVDEVLPTLALLESCGTNCTLGLVLFVGRVAVAAIQLHSA